MVSLSGIHTFPTFYSELFFLIFLYSNSRPFTDTSLISLGPRSGRRGSGFAILDPLIHINKLSYKKLEMHCRVALRTYRMLTCLLHSESLARIQS